MRNLVEIARSIGAVDIDGEDDALAYFLNNRVEPWCTEARGRLHEKYYAIMLGYIDHRFPRLSATAKDQIADGVFDRIDEYVSATPRDIYTVDGKLGPFLILICEWVARQILRLERRRQDLLRRKFQEIWCIQRDESQKYRGDAITDQDIEDLIAALRKAFDPESYPNTAPIMAAISAVYVESNGVQVVGLERSPSLNSIKNQLEKTGVELSEAEIARCLGVLRNRARTVLKENGWEITLPPPGKCVP